MDKTFLTQGKDLGNWVFSNVAILTWVIDMWTVKKKKFQSEQFEEVHEVKLEFQYPKIERTRGDWKTWPHIKAEQMKISNFKSTSPDMKNAKFVNILIALWANSLPLDNDWCLPFIKDYLWKFLIVESTTKEWTDGHIYDEVTDFKKLPEWTTQDAIQNMFPKTKEINKIYFNLKEFTQESYDKLMKRDQEKIAKTKEYQNATTSKAEDALINTDDLPF